MSCRTCKPLDSLVAHLAAWGRPRASAQSYLPSQTTSVGVPVDVEAGGAANTAKYSDLSKAEGYGSTASADRLSSTGLIFELVCRLRELLADRDIVGDADRPAAWLPRNAWYRGSSVEGFRQLLVDLDQAVDLLRTDLGQTQEPGGRPISRNRSSATTITSSLSTDGDSDKQCSSESQQSPQTSTYMTTSRR
jgi:hypothetical protein